MHPHKQIFLGLFALAMTAPLAQHLPALLSFDERNAAQESLDEAIGEAMTDYKRRSNLVSLNAKGEKTKEILQKKLSSLDADKRRMRIRILALRRVSDQVRRKYDLSFTGSTALQSVLRREEAVLARLMKEQYRLTASERMRNAGEAILDIVRGGPDKESVRTRIASQLHFVKDLHAAQVALAEEEKTMVARDTLLADYALASKEYRKADEAVALNALQLEQIKIITKDVHDEVLRLQGQLARIDDNLRSAAQRDLIKKGLLDKDDIALHAAATATPSFNWPVYGPVSAGFMLPSYKKHFGVNHYGTDIVVAQETPVASAADGIVFMVRDGGATGYTYILIGHRGGYATLYGHLSATLVASGQSVKKGDVIGLSGGQPGTHGAGPMTTAAHLHFEVIKDGTNVNPVSLLP